MPSIFTNSEDQNWNGSFRADDLKLTFDAGGDGAGALVQSANWNVRREAQMIYELGSPNIYYVGNRRSGTIQLNRVVAASEVYQSLIDKFGDMCSPKAFELEVSGGCGGEAVRTRTYTMNFAILMGIQGSVEAQSIVVNEQIDFMFSDMEVS
jgi:hypothetical protein